MNQTSGFHFGKFPGHPSCLCTDFCPSGHRNIPRWPEAGGAGNVRSQLVTGTGNRGDTKPPGLLTELLAAAASTETCGILGPCPGLRGHTGVSRTPLLAALKANTLQWLGREAAFIRFPIVPCWNNSDKILTIQILTELQKEGDSRINQLRGHCCVSQARSCP